MKNRFRFFLWLTVIYSLLIFYLSSRPSLGDAGTIFGFLHLESLMSLLRFMEHSDMKFILYPLFILSRYPDKIAHIALYAGFGFLLYHTFRNSSDPTFRNRAFLFAIAAGILYGAGDEFHQAFVPGRTASMWDLLADGIGLALAQTVIFIKDNLCFIRKNSSIKKQEKY